MKAKKTNKKVVKKATTKKAAPKKVVKKAAPKKAVKKAASKKAVKKAAPKKGKKSNKKIEARVRKSSKKIVTTTTTVVTTTVTTTPKETHYLLILDESGSMSGVQKQTLDGLNEQINMIKGLGEKYPNQEYFVSIVKFDNEIVSLFEDVPASKLKQLNKSDYQPDATTALHDAIGISVNKLKDKISTKLENGEADAFVVILTDGFENASQEFSAEKIKNLIEGLEATKMWTFTFIGANQDAVTTAGNLGISYANTANFTASGQGSTLAFDALKSSFSKRAVYRSAGVFTNDSYLSQVVASNNIGENADLLDLSGNVSDEDIQKAKDILNNSKTS